jgi:ribosomal protein L7/L12
LKQFAAMDEKIIKLGDGLMALTTAEALELQKYLESKGLVMQQAAPVAQEQAKVEEVKESANVNVRLINAGSIIKLAKALMPRTGKTAMELKKLTEELPAILMENVTREVGKSFISDVKNELTGDEFAFDLQDC